MKIVSLLSVVFVAALCLPIAANEEVVQVVPEVAAEIAPEVVAEQAPAEEVAEQASEEQNASAAE